MTESAFKDFVPHESFDGLETATTTALAMELADNLLRLEAINRKSEELDGGNDSGQRMVHWFARDVLRHRNSCISLVLHVRCESGTKFGPGFLLANKQG